MDVNVRAYCVVQAALADPPKNLTIDAKKTSGRQGGLVGGPSRARSISAERRREIAKKASAARWSKEKSAATCADNL